MDSIAKTFKKHSYHIDYLNAKTSEETKKGVSVSERSLVTFMSYYDSAEKPDESINFLS